MIGGSSVSSRSYNLDERTFVFARGVRDFIKAIPYTLSNKEYGRQIIRSSASVGANYIEADESLSRKDFMMRIKICRKEAKESIYWFKLIEVDSGVLEKERDGLLCEAGELMKIFGSIIRKSEG